ncbi:MAG: MFS transporter [Alphaproteobacteria bacterium]|nr:MFS transporter [Alphaproteobacteria bacterium]
MSSSIDAPITISRPERLLADGFNRLVWSNLLAQSAEQIGLAAAPIVAVFAFGAGAGETGLLQTAQTLPFLLLAIPAGLLADRASRRHLMALAEALRAASLLAILLLSLAGLLTLPLLALLGFIGASGTVAYSVAAPSLVPAMVEAGGLGAANRRLELARSVAFAGGPALGGALVGWIGAAPAFGIAAAFSGYAVVLLFGLPEPPRPALAPRNIGRDLKEGAGFLFAHPLLRPVLLTAVVFNTSFLVMQAIYVAYAVEKLALSPTSIGATLAAYGVGMVAGALLASRLAKCVTFGAMIAIGPIAGCCSALVMLLTIWVPSVALAGLSFFLIGAGPVLWTISTTTLRQAVTPGPLLGRVSAVLLMATWGTRPLGAAIGAFVGARYGAESCLGIAACGFIAQAAIILLSPVPRLQRQPGENTP